MNAKFTRVNSSDASGTTLLVTILISLALCIIKMPDGTVMPSRPLLLLGNLIAVTITIAALAQALSWTLAGILILVSLILPLLVNIAPPRAQLTQHPASRMPNANHRSSDTSSQQKLGEKHPPFSYQSARKQEPKAASGQHALRSTQPEKGSVVPSISAPPAPQGMASPSRPSPAKKGPDLNPTIAKDDYVEYDVELETGTEFLGEVTADGLVNVYLLDEENLDNLDEGEEFWSETGEEGVESAQLEFTAPSEGQWFFVIENADDRAITATVKIHKESDSTT